MAETAIVMASEYGLSRNYRVEMPLSSIRQLAEAAEVRWDGLDELAIHIRHWHPLYLGTCQLHTEQARQSTQRRTATITAYLQRFVGYGAFRYSTVHGQTINRGAQEIDNANFAGVLLHELLHLSFAQERLNGGKPNFTPPPTIQHFGSGWLRRAISIPSRTLSEEEFTKFRTPRILTAQPELEESVTVKKL